MLLRRTCIAVAVVALCATAASSAIAKPRAAAHRLGRIHGIVPVHGRTGRIASFAGNLTYHRGLVMHANTVHAIYWLPAGSSVSTNYQSLINGFFGNVAADSAKSSNVYFSDTQYSDTSGPIAYSSTFANSFVDTSQFPRSGCRDRYTSVCLTDGQLQSEITRLVSQHNWNRGLGDIYFLFTPRNVGSCYGSSCSFSYFCAYHSQIGSGGPSTILYANMPYAAWVPGACGSGQSPNNDDADSTINVTSHEHNETITDPLGTAWYDRTGAEDGDRCAWNFGTAIGSTASGAYNQTINGTGHYYLQQEWSNNSSGCVLTGT